MTITVEAGDKLVVRREDEILVADEAGKDYGFDGVYQTEVVKMKKLHAVIYSQSGQVLKQLRGKDIKESSVTRSVWYQKHKTKFYRLSCPTLPYRLVRLKEYECKSTFFWPDWHPQGEIPVERAELELILKSPVEFDYRAPAGTPGPEVFTDAQGYQRYRWVLEEIPARAEEYRQAPEAAFKYGVNFRPLQFEFTGTAGKSDSWQAFGAWFHRLIEKQIAFSPGVAEFDSYAAIPGVDERVRQLYRYLQKKTKYKIDWKSSKEPWQPHRVDDIHRAKYGDCKDLSAYLVAMLARAGIEAYPALALPRNHGWVDADFPTNRFNHCIAVVPTETDTFWLECTSDAARFNDPPAWIEGVNVLLVKPDGGHLVRTPLSKPEQNKSSLMAHARLSKDRSLAVEGTLTLTGNRAIDARGRLSHKNKAEQIEWLLDHFSGKAGDAICNSMKIEGLTNPDTTFTLTFDVTLKYFARKAGSRLRFSPRLFHAVYFAGEAPEDRSMPLLNMTRFVDEDSVVYELPDGFELKGDPGNISENSAFGSFSLRLVPDLNNKLIWTSTFLSRAREISLEAYPDYYEFMTAARKRSQKKVVLQEYRGTF